MSAASKARRKAIRRQVRDEQRLGDFWKEDYPKSITVQGETVTVQYIAREDERVKVMHKVAAGSQHRGLCNVFMFKKPGEKAFAIGECGEKPPAWVLADPYLARQYKAGMNAAANAGKRLANKAKKRMVREQRALLEQACRDNGIMPTDQNIALMAEISRNAGGTL